MHLLDDIKVFHVLEMLLAMPPSKFLYDGKSSK